MNERPPIIAQPIKVLQLNIQRKKHTTIQLLNSLHTDFDILLLQEPAWSFIGRDQTSGRDIDGPVALKGWQTILPVTSTDHNSPRPRTLTYYRPRNDFNITLRSDLLEDRDIQVLEISQANHPNTLVINVYNDSPKGDLCVLNKLQDIISTFPDHPTIITGDFNLHHPNWSREDRALDQDQLAISTAEWLANKNFTLLNTRGETTHLARHAGERPSVIDLSFTNAEASRLDSFKQWAVDPNLALERPQRHQIHTRPWPMRNPRLLPDQVQPQQSRPGGLDKDTRHGAHQLRAHTTPPPQQPSLSQCST